MTSDSASGVATDAEGNVYVVGRTEGSFGGSQQGGGGDAFVIKFDRDGNELWKKQPGTNGFDSAEGVASDGDGNVYVVIATSAENTSNLGALVIKFDRNGRELWRDQQGTTADDVPYGVATDVNGNAYMVGSTLDSLGGPNLGGGDAFLIKYGPNGPQ